MVYNSSGSQWVIGHVIWFITALALSRLLVMLYGSQQLWLSVGYLSCNMVRKSSGSQRVIGHVIWFTTSLTLCWLFL